MKVRNVHERQLQADVREIGALIDALSSKHDRLWPIGTWPRMTFDRPLGPGAVGGHGPVRYAVEDYVPGRSVTFRFLRPAGFDGWHRVELLEAGSEAPILRHTLEMTARGLARITWPLVFRPLHDALIEDALAGAEAALGLHPTVRPWPASVRLLRFVLSKGTAPLQKLTAPVPSMSTDLRL